MNLERREIETEIESTKKPLMQRLKHSNFVKTMMIPLGLGLGIASCTNKIDASNSLLSSFQSSELNDLDYLKDKDIESARNTLNKAAAFIKDHVKNKDRFGKLDLENLDRFLPLMIKESRLKSDAVSRSNAHGYFQLIPGRYSSVRDVMKEYQFDISESSIERGFDEPLYNCVIGILYLQLCEHKYANHNTFNTLSSSEKSELSYMIFNKGPTSIRRLWEMIKPGSLAEFEEELAKQLGKNTGVVVGDKVEVPDESYQVNYETFELIPNLVKGLGKNLKSTFVYDGNKTSLRNEQVLEVLRYLHVIRALEDYEDTIINDDQDEGFFSGFVEDDKEEKVEIAYTDNPPNLLKKDLIYFDSQSKKARMIWTVANELLDEIKSVDDHFAGYHLDEYFPRTEFREHLIKVLLDYNFKYNKDFNEKNIKRTGDITVELTSSKLGIFIPDFDYIKKVFLADIEESDKKLDKRLQEESVIKAYSESGFYVDDALESEGSKLLNDKYDYNFEREVDFDTFRNTRTRKGKVKNGFGALPARNIKYILLHSTGGSSINTIKTRGAICHFIVDRNGKIYSVVDLDRRPNHTKHFSVYRGVKRLDNHSISIEVVAKGPKNQRNQSWSNEQYESVKELVHYLGDKFNLRKRDVIGHFQIGKHGRLNIRSHKADPYNFDFTRLNLPDNAKLLDQDVINCVLPSIYKTMDKELKMKVGPWYKADRSMLVGIMESGKIAERKCKNRRGRYVRRGRR